MTTGGFRRAGSRWLRLPVERTALRFRALRDGLVLAGLMTTAFILIVIPYYGRSLGYDAMSYWFQDLPARYALAERGIYELGAFRYAPPIGLLFSPLGMLPWWFYVTVWAALGIGCLVWLGGRWAIVLLALPPVALELYHGNIHLLMAVAIALGFRYPVAWSFVLLTKVTPGIGLLWFAVRREWRSLGIALAATLVIAAVSYLIAPALWGDWFATLQASIGRPADLSLPPPFWARLPIAIVLVVWGARTDRRWTVAIAATLALPNVWPHGLVVALGALPFIRPRTRDIVPEAGSARSFARIAGAAVAIGAVIAVIGSWFLALLITSASSVILARFAP